ncbi:FkbM family methyltransferase [Streptomyces sp. NBC_01717]|uniref:FkbM family methyltransferase n=1 Tax=unclassified Streptomyces TaxID=2593676 RepID=UPI002E321024|nr:FkbM family methyltransferase [Streptomyces sp. NBC_01717]
MTPSLPRSWLSSALPDARRIGGETVALPVRELPNGWTVASVNRSETDYLYKEIFVDETYRSGLRDLTADRPVVFDVGANIGLFSLYAAQEWPEARIFAFEPAPEVFEALEENMRIVENASLFRLALGERGEEREFSYYPGYTMMSGFEADPEADRVLVESFIENQVNSSVADAQRRPALVDSMAKTLDGRFRQEKFPVRVERLADIATAHGVDRIDLLKLDVEGSELDVLLGISASLWKGIGQVVAEVADRDGELAAVTDLFTRHGMLTRVEQSSEYAGTGLSMVFAWRP